MPVGKVRLSDIAPGTRRDPLEHWLDQEQAAAPLDEYSADDRQGALPSGWWLLPVLLLALPLWATLIWAVLAG